MKWSQICEPVQGGGLGIRCIWRFNQALLGKCLWRDDTEGDALWRRVIEKKYGSDWGWGADGVKKLSGPLGISLWKSIRWQWPTFSKPLWFDVGDGTREKFWHDVWCGDYPQKEFLPESYCIIRSREASVAEVICLANGRLHWDIQFSRSMHDWELESLALFVEMIYTKSVRGDGCDKVCWKPAVSRDFEVCITLYPHWESCHSLGKWCGKPRSLLAWHSFLGLLRWARYY